MENSFDRMKKVDSDILGEVEKIADNIVNRYIARSIIPAHVREDVKMTVVEKFYEKKDQIMSAFEGKSKLSTYFVAIINRMCCEVIRKEKKHWDAVTENECTIIQNESTPTFETIKEMLIKEEVRRLSDVLLFFNGSSAKVNLFLKFYFKIPVQVEDIERYCVSSVKEIHELISENQNENKTVMFEKMADIMYLAENKRVGGDAVRIWLTKQIDTILNKLNGLNHTYHDKETLAILFEMKEHLQHNK